MFQEIKFNTSLVNRIKIVISLAEFCIKCNSIYIENFNLINYCFVTYLKCIFQQRKQCFIFSSCFRETVRELLFPIAIYWRDE